MTTLYYYDASDYELGEWERNMSLFDNTTGTYRFDEVVCIFVDLLIHIFGYALAWCIVSLTLSFIIMILIAPILMCLALCYNREQTDARFYQREINEF